MLNPSFYILHPSFTEKPYYCIMLAPYFHENRIEAGCDEAGRGCLAGPVFAAAVIWPKHLVLEGLNDSKKLNGRQRLELRELIREKALAYAVASVDQDQIDVINILQASIKAMHLAVDALKSKPDHLLIDGNRFNPYPDIPHTCIVKGDGRFASIAAASILAKTCRDEYMEKLDEHFPQYAWKKNKGYPTREHRAAIAAYGLTGHHRKSFTFKGKGLKLERTPLCEGRSEIPTDQRERRDQKAEVKAKVFHHR
jgi:ribonuclease HII